MRLKSKKPKKPTLKRAKYFGKIKNLIFTFIFTIIVTVFATYIFQLTVCKKFKSINIEETKTIAQESEKNIIQAIKYDEYDQAIKLFENQKYEEAKKLIMDIFGINKYISNDDMHGYIVSLYCKQKNFEQAALEVIKRDNKLPFNNYELWKDMALCIRNYTLNNSLPAGIDLVNRLKKINSKIVSYAWTVLPIELIYSLRKGAHNDFVLLYGLENVDRKNIQYVINEYPNDPYIDILLYANGEFDKVLSKKKRSFIRDVVLFAAGYEEKIELERIFYLQSINNIKTDSSNNDNLNKRYKRARSYFLNYIDNYPKLIHADDSVVWLGWLEWKFGKIEEALNWFNKARLFGNGDFVERARYYSTEMLLELPIDKLKNIVLNDTEILNIVYLRLHVALYYFRNNEYQLARDFAEYALENIDESTLGNKEKQYYREIVYINKTSKDIIELLIKDDPYEYKKYGNKIRINHYDYRTAIYLIDKAIERHPKSSELDKILYLKILALRDWKPDEVERTVKYFYRMFPKSIYIDDAFAELAFVQIIIQGNTNMGRKTIEKLLCEYENTNACDNALNWLAYYQVINEDYKSAKETYEEILNKFPNTRFARYAKNNLIKIGENINNKRD